MLALSGFVLELDVAGACEVLPEEVRGAGLERFAVLHHGLDAKGVLGPGEAFAVGLAAFDDGHGHVVLGEVGVNVEHAVCFLARLRCGGVDGVAFLPEELGGAQEEPCAHFPAHDVGPLVDEDGEVAVGLHPLGVGFADDGLGGGAHDEGFLELAGGDEPAVRAGFEARVGDDGALFCKPFHVRGLLLDVAAGDEEREVGIGVPRGLEHGVERPLDVFPKRVAPRFDDHAAAHGAVLGEVGGLDNLLIPLRVVLGARWRDGGLDGFAAH